MSNVSDGSYKFAVTENLVPQKWETFRDAGLLWFMNRLLHVFGWAIVLETQAGKVIKAYPCRTGYRGFQPELDDEGFKKVSQYMVDTSEALNKEANV